MKAYHGKPQFGGGWDDDLDNCLGLYETLLKMCSVTQEQMLAALPVVLTVDAMIYYSNTMQDCQTYADVIALLKRWYSSDGKKYRILTDWKGTELSKAMSAAPTQSEAAVIRTFVAKLMSLQKRLDMSYQSDSFLRDRLLTATDVPAIQSTLRAWMPRTSQQAVSRIKNHLSDSKRAAGSSSVCQTILVRIATSLKIRTKFMTAWKNPSVGMR